MPEDEEEVDIGEEVIEEPEPEVPAKKLAGKYNSVEDLEKSYLEEQSALTRLAQENAELRKAQVALQTTETQPQNPTYQTSAEDPWADAFDSTEQLGKRVQETVYGAIGQFAQITRNADANIENLLLERESDPMFKEVGRMFRAELKRVEPQYMVDANQAAQIAENVYNSVCGKHARTILAKTRENPAERTKYLESLGVESPQAKDDTDVEAVTRGEVDMLRGLGLNKKSRESVVRRVAQKRDEEEE